MKVQILIRTLLGALALGSILASSTRLFGDEPPRPVLDPLHDGPPRRLNQLNEKNRFEHAGPEIADVALDAHGNLHGSFVDRTGQPLSGSLVIVRQGEGRLHTAQTDATGNFEVAGLNGGVWSLTVGSKSSVLRAWAHDTAPPAARSRLLMVGKTRIVRGQSEESSILTMFDSGTLFSAGVGLTGITLGTIGISEANEANDEASALRNELNALGDTTTANQSAISVQNASFDSLSMTVEDLVRTLN